MVAAIPCGHPDNLEHIDEFKRESVALANAIRRSAPQLSLITQTNPSHNAKLIHWRLLPSPFSCENRAHINCL